MRRDGLHAASPAGHLDHYLRRSAHHGRLDALADGRCTVARGKAAELWLRLRLLDAVGGIEEPITPLDQHTFDVGRLGHVDLLRVMRLQVASVRRP